MDEINGHYVAHTLGQMTAQNAELIRLHQANIGIQQRIQDELQEMPHRLAEVIMRHGERHERRGILSRLDISLRELIIVGAAILTGVAGLARGVSLHDTATNIQEQVRGE